MPHLPSAMGTNEPKAARRRGRAVTDGGWKGRRGGRKDCRVEVFSAAACLQAGLKGLVGGAVVVSRLREVRC